MKIIDIAKENEIPRTEFVPREKDPYKVHIGKPVELATGRNYVYGFYAGMTEKGDLILQPFLAEENHQVPGLDKDRDERWTKVFVWTDRPAYFAFQHGVSGVLPAREEYLEMLVGKTPPLIGIPRRMT